MVLGYRLWQERFGARPSVVGETLILNGEPYVVVGIAPRDFELPALATDVVTPLIVETDPLRDDRGTNFLRLLGRLAPDTGIDQARDELAAITASAARSLPGHQRQEDGAASGAAARRDRGRPGARRCRCSTALRRWFCWWPAPISPICCSRAPTIGGASSRSGQRSARRARGSCSTRDRRRDPRSAGGVPALLVARWCVDLLRRFGPSGVAARRARSRSTAG